MINNFVWQFGTKIIFGAGTQSQVGKECAAYGKKVLLVRDSGSFLDESGLLDQVKQSLNQSGVEYTELSGIQPNPTIDKVREGVELFREKCLSVVLAVGGGSAIDTAKGIAAAVHWHGDPWDLYIGKGEVKNPPPVGVILTIAATGSEGSIGSVISNPQTQQKFDVLDASLRPAFAILNPELTLTLPEKQTVCGVTDILSHCMERYFTNSTDVELTDRLGEAVMKTAINNGLLLKQNGQNVEARSQVMWAGTLAHNGLLEGGRNGCWASHAIGTELSAHYNVTHGASLSVITPAWMKYTYKSDIPRFARFASKVMDVEYDANNPEETARRGIVKLEELFKELGMPTSIRELGINTQELFDRMAASATRNGPIGCIRSLEKADVLEILRLAY